MNLENITSGAVTEPFDLAAAKAHLVVHSDADDALITTQITAARVVAENFTGRMIAAGRWRLTLDCFPAAIELPKRDVIGVTQVQYVDGGGATQTLGANAYTLRHGSNCVCLVPAYNTTWPATEPGYNKVTIEFDAGYAAGKVPADLQAAIKLILGELYLHREDSIEGMALNAVPLSSQHLMRPYKLVSL